MRYRLVMTQTEQTTRWSCSTVRDARKDARVQCGQGALRYVRVDRWNRITQTFEPYTAFASSAAGRVREVA